MREDQTLATIDTGAVETGQFLKDIISNPPKYKCLQTFSDCQEIIEWLKEFTQSKLNSSGLPVSLHGLSIYSQVSLTSKDL